MRNCVVILAVYASVAFACQSGNEPRSVETAAVAETAHADYLPGGGAGGGAA